MPNNSFIVQVDDIKRRMGQRQLGLILPGIGTNGKVRAKPFFNGNTKKGGASIRNAGNIATGSIRALMMVEKIVIRTFLD